MQLDHSGVLISCSSCGTTNRLRFTSIELATRCAKCKAPLPVLDEPLDVTSTASFDAAVTQLSVPVVVDFWAAWCGPCRMVAPELVKVAKHLAGRAVVLKVDTDALPDVSARYGIRSIPSILVFYLGKEMNRAAGARPAEAIEAMLTQAA